MPLLHAIALCGLMLAAGCSHASQRKQQFVKTLPTPRTIYVVGHGWHTGLVIPVADIPPNLLPELNDFPPCDYIELGWGDAGFYRAKKINPGLVMKAAFWPTPSVLHVAAFRGPPERFYPYSDIVEVPLTDRQLAKLCRFAHDSFTRNERGTSESLGPGIGEGVFLHSGFYRANGKYFLPKTCNTWTANALKTAGFPVIPSLSATAESVLRQSKKFGRVLRESPNGLKAAVLRGGE